MPNVIADITMSLDGFVTGEGADEQHGLGDAPVGFPRNRGGLLIECGASHSSARWASPEIVEGC
jgi:hypothetical protein